MFFKNIQKQILLPLFFIISTGIQSSAGYWEKIYMIQDDSYGLSLQKASDGGFIIAGGSRHSVNGGGVTGDVYIIRTNSQGDTLWTKTYGGNGYEEAQSIDCTYDGGFIVAGYTTSFGSVGSDVYLLRIDTKGDTLWTKTYGEPKGNEIASAVQQTLDSGFIIAGSTNSSDSSKMYLIRTNSKGDIIWEKKFGTNIWGNGVSIKQTPDSGFVIVGGTSNYRSQAANFIRTDKKGDIVWKKYLNAKLSCIYQTNDSGFIICGTLYISGTPGIDSSRNDVYLARTNRNGDTLWTRTYPHANFSYGHSVFQASNGDFIIGGEAVYVGKNQSILIIQVNSSGVLISKSIFGNSGSYVGRSIQQYLNSGIMITGEISPNSTSKFGIYLAHIDLQTAIAGENGFCTFPTISNADINIDFTIRRSGSVLTILYGSKNSTTLSNINVELFNQKGEKIARIDYCSYLKGFRKIDCNLRKFNLSSGIYFLCFTYNNNMSKRIKVMISN